MSVKSVQWGRIDTLVDEFLEFCHYSRTVFLECYPEPVRRGREQFDFCRAVLDHAVDSIRDIEFSLELVAVLLDEILENHFAFLEIVRSESPHVH